MPSEGMTPSIWSAALGSLNPVLWVFLEASLHSYEWWNHWLLINSTCSLSLLLAGKVGGEGGNQSSNPVVIHLPLLGNQPKDIYFFRNSRCFRNCVPGSGTKYIFLIINQFHGMRYQSHVSWHPHQRLSWAFPPGSAPAWCCLQGYLPLLAFKFLPIASSLSGCEAL